MKSGICRKYMWKWKKKYNRYKWLLKAGAAFAAPCSNHKLWEKGEWNRLEMKNE